MKIVEQTPNRLRLQADNLMTAMGTVLFGSIFVVAGLAAIVFLVNLLL
jgi:hypothetical protein